MNHNIQKISIIKKTVIYLSLLLVCTVHTSFRTLSSKEEGRPDVSLSMLGFKYETIKVNERNDSGGFLDLGLFSRLIEITGTRLDLFSGEQNFPESYIGKTVTKTFVIKNQDTEALTLPDGVAILGEYEADFSVTRQPATSVAAGDYTTFDISFTPSTNNSITYATESPATYLQFPNNNLDVDILYGIGTTVVMKAPPTAANVNFIGMLEVGQQVSGTYDWAGVDAGDVESGSTYQWYRSDDASGNNKIAIAAAHNQNYTMVLADIGKFISFEVIPNDGINAGAPVESSLQGPVAFSPNVTSIVRQTPVDASTSADEVIFRVTFDKVVKNVDVSDFSLNGSASGDATISTVTAISTSVYDVKITGIASANGTVNLDIKGNDGMDGTNDIVSVYVGRVSESVKIDQPDSDDYLNQAKLGQTFTATTSNTLTQVTFFPKAEAHTFSGTADLKIYNGDETAGGTELSSETITMTNNTDSEGQSFVFSSPQSLTTGNVYSIVLTNFSGSGSHALASNTTATYAGGHVIFTGQAASHDDFDLKIKIYESIEGEIEGNALSVTAPGTDETFSITNNKAPIAMAPTAPTVTEGAMHVALADDIQLSDINADDTQTVIFTIIGGTLTLGTEGVTFGGEGNGTASFTAAGSLSSINTALDAATFTPTAELIGISAGTISFIASDGTVDSNTATVSFDIEDVTNPVLTNTNPMDGGSNFTGTSITFTFDENIVKGSGRISVVDASNDQEIAGSGVGGARVSINGNTATLDLGNALPLGKQVYVRVPAGAFKDASNNEFRGLLDKTTLNFASPTIPILQSTNPADNATDFSSTALSFTFDRNMTKGSGRISIMDASNDQEITGAGVGSSRVSIADNVVTFDLVTALPLNKEVYVRIPRSAFQDVNNNFYPGILDKTTLNFASPSTPLLVASSPSDETTEFGGSTITLSFNREVFKGSGRISILDANDDSEVTGAGVGSNKITIKGPIVTIDLINPLPEDKQVYLNVPASAFKDVNNNFFSGILDKTTLNFSSQNSINLLSFTPTDNSVDFSGSVITLTFDENVVKGTGRISVMDAADDSELSGAGVGSSRITINNNVVTMDLINPLPFDREVYLKIPPSAFTDANNISFSGILDKTSINFATPTTPQLLSTDPVNGGIDFNSKIITFTFDRDVSKGRGRLRVFNRADDTEITGAGVNSSRVTITENVVTLDLIKSLPSGISAYVKIPTVAFKDVNNRFYKGMLDKTTLSFNTLNTATGAPAAFNDDEVVDQQASLIQEELPLTVAINLYPNPASKVINIDLSTAGAAPDLRIIDVTGTEKLSIYKVKQRRLSLDVSQYAGGLYIAIVKTSTGQLIRKKFMIRR